MVFLIASQDSSSGVPDYQEYRATYEQLIASKTSRLYKVKQLYGLEFINKVQKSGIAIVR